MLFISTTWLIIGISIAVVLTLSLAYLFWTERKKNQVALNAPVEKGKDPGTTQLQLQAYERLILLADRIALPNLISRVGKSDTTAREMQQILLHTIRQEYEYNVTQQIYVSQAAWDAVTNLKEQNMLIINQVASLLPPDASGTDLNKYLLEMLVENPNVSLHKIVEEAINFEAKKLIGT